MLDYILIVLIVLTILISLSIVQIWKKNNYVKELYMSEGVSLAFYIIDVAITIGLITIYFVKSKGFPYSWVYLLIVLGINVIMFLFYSYSATICVYLKEDSLIRKSIFGFKEIKINKEIKIIEKIDKTIIKSTEKSISISARYLTGNLRSFLNKVKEIIDQID